MTDLLTIPAAKAYVAAYCASHNLGTPDVEGAGIFMDGGSEICRMNVNLDGGCYQWDVWVDGDCLYGEF